MLTRLRERNVVTIPTAIIKQLKLRPGDEVEVSLEDGSIKLTPVVVIPKEQAWFYQDHWQNGMAQAMDDIKKGRINKYDNAQELFAVCESSGDGSGD